MINLHNAEFITSVYDYLKMPRIECVQVAFAGRSNVGKSSLINTVLNRKNFARTSATPGKTASINIYNIDKKVALCDLPGYGFAKTSKSLKKSWGSLIDGYFQNESPSLVIHIVDIRHKPTDDDVIMNTYLKECGFNYITVLSKADKISKTAAAEQKAALDGVFSDNCIIFSAKTGQGKEEIIDKIKETVGDN